jgi:hypothetical protein
VEYAFAEFGELAGVHFGVNEDKKLSEFGTLIDPA